MNNNNNNSNNSNIMLFSQDANGLKTFCNQTRQLMELDVDNSTNPPSATQPSVPLTCWQRIMVARRKLCKITGLLTFNKQINRMN